MALLTEDSPTGVQPVGFTPDEFARGWGRHNPLARGVLEEGVVLRGEEFFEATAASR